MHIATILSRCRHVCRGRHSINELSTLYVMHKWIHTSTIRVLTMVNPRVAVIDGVSVFGPKVHLRGVKALYTQTWWLRPPPLLSERSDLLIHVCIQGYAFVCFSTFGPCQGCLKLLRQLIFHIFGIIRQILVACPKSVGFW